MCDGYRDPYDDENEEEDERSWRWCGESSKHTPPEGSPGPKPYEPPRAPTTPDGLPIPADVLKWYPEALYRWLTVELFDGDGGQGWIAKYREWFQDRPADFLLYERFGEGCSMWGGWRLNETAMWGAVPDADADLGWKDEPEKPAPPATPIEPATEADVDAALDRLHKERLPEEKWAGAVLYRSGDPTDAFHAMRRRIKTKTPIPCRCCGGFFLVPTGQNLANCPDCRAAGRKRGLDCNGVFVSPQNGKRKNSAKRCESCLAREAEYQAQRRHH